MYMVKNETRNDGAARETEMFNRNTDCLSGATATEWVKANAVNGKIASSRLDFAIKAGTVKMFLRRGFIKPVKVEGAWFYRVTA